MSSMFNSCYDLTSVDLSSFNTSSVTDMNAMFSNCPSIISLDLSSFSISSSTMINEMFYVEKDAPLLITTNDNTLLKKYKYDNDNRFPGGPVFEANGGSFSLGSTDEFKYYFEKCAVSVSSPKFDIENFKEFKKELKPTKNNFIFSGWTTEETEPTNSGQLIDPITYLANWSIVNSNIPSQNQDNTLTSTLSSFGIAYIPKQFVIEATPLETETNQVIQFGQADSFHIGVRDIRNIASSWELSAHLQWEGKVLPGAKIVLGNSTGKVQKNINNGEEQFNSSTDFTDCSEVVGEKEVVITSNQENLIMSGKKVVHNAVYDYNLGGVSLIIPEPKYVEASVYTGKVVWNLSNTL